MQSQCKPVVLLDSPDAIAGLLAFESRKFDHLETASDLALVSALYDAVDRVADAWLRVELDVVATVAAARWAPGALDAFEAGLRASQR